MSEERHLFPVQREDNVVAAIVPPPPSDPLASQPLLIPMTKGAKLLGISTASAYRWAESGELPTCRMGGRLYIITAKLRELLESA